MEEVTKILPFNEEITIAGLLIWRLLAEAMREYQLPELTKI